MANIVLRNRNGEKIDHPGIDYLNVKTQDGGTQGYAAYDPETLVPENLASGVVVGDVEGKLEVPQAVETTIDPDFSAGDMEIFPQDGTLFSKVGVQKPSNLEPGNIAKGVDVAGVVGTLEGGASLFPLLFMRVSASAWRTGSSAALSKTIYTTIPKNSTIVGHYYFDKQISSTASGDSESTIRSDSDILKSSDTAPTETTTGYSVKRNMTFAAMSYQNRVLCATLIVVFTMQGVYYTANEDGTINIYADETATTLPAYPSIFLNKISIPKIDLSNSNITEIPTYFDQTLQIKEIIFPATITTIAANALRSTTLTTLDFSRATAAPTVLSTSIYRSDSLVIKVPAALYDQWITTASWSVYKNYIVAV